VGQQVPISIVVDGSQPYNLTATAVTKTFASAALPATAAVFDQMRKGYQMRVYAQGNQYGFNLNGTYAALTEVVSCVTRFVQPARPPAPMVNAAPPSNRPNAPALTVEQRLEATTLVANLLSQGDMTGYRILSPKEVQDLKVPSLSIWDVVWHAEDVLGAMRIVPSKLANSASAIASAMIADDSKGCTGSFASGSTPDDKSKSTTRVFTVCKTDKQAWEAHYIVTPRDDGGFYLFATFGRAASDKAASSSSNHADGLLRAAVFEVLKH
jgi:hypothetical protein